MVVVCDGLTDLPQTVTTVWPQAIVQTCRVHLTRASLRWVGYQDRKRVGAQLKLIYGRPTEQAARDGETPFRLRSSVGRAGHWTPADTQPLTDLEALRAARLLVRSASRGLQGTSGASRLAEPLGVGGGPATRYTSSRATFSGS